MRQAVLLGAAVILVAAAVAGRASSSGRALTSVTIVVLPVEPAALGFYAKERGFFAQQGIDARFAIVQDGAQGAAALLSGDAQFAGTTVGAFANLRSRGAPVRVVAAGALYRRSAPTSALVAARGRTFAGPRSLVGKRIAIEITNSLAHVGALLWLKRGGVAADHVEFAQIPFPEMLGPLLRGDVDAAVMPEPYVTLARQRGLKVIAHPADAMCPQDCLTTMWMARRDVDPNLAARFRNAVQAAAVWANKRRNDTASAAILSKYTSVDRALIAKMTRSPFAQRLRPAAAQPVIDAFAEFGVIPASFSALDLVK